MLSLNTDRFWTILFTIPLPLMLSSVAVAQEATVDPEPIRIATETTIKLAAIDVGNLNFHQPKLESRVGQSAAGWIHQTVTNAQWAMLDRVDPLRLIHPTTRQVMVEPMKIGGTHFKATRERIDTRAHQGIDLVVPLQKTLRRWVSGYDAVTGIRFDKFNSFDSQAPPRDSFAITSATASKHLVRLPPSEFNRGTQSLSEPRAYAANLILLDYCATFDADLVSLFAPRRGDEPEPDLVPPNDFRRPQRFRIEPLVLVQST